MRRRERLAAQSPRANHASQGLAHGDVVVDDVDERIFVLHSYVLTRVTEEKLRNKLSMCEAGVVLERLYSGYTTVGGLTIGLRRVEL